MAQITDNDMVLAVLLKRRKAAITLAVKYGQIDGAHHKMWVIDQMIRKLLGAAEYKKYSKKVLTAEGDKWDVGIAP